MRSSCSVEANYFCELTNLWSSFFVSNARVLKGEMQQGNHCSLCMLTCQSLRALDIRMNPINASTIGSHATDWLFPLFFFKKRKTSFHTKLYTVHYACFLKLFKEFNYKMSISVINYVVYVLAYIARRFVPVHLLCPNTYQCSRVGQWTLAHRIQKKSHTAKQQQASILKQWSDCGFFFLIIRFCIPS
jgi:hypothetical protein